MKSLLWLAILIGILDDPVQWNIMRHLRVNWSWLLILQMSFPRCGSVKGGGIQIVFGLLVEEMFPKLRVISRWMHFYHKYDELELVKKA